MGNIDQLQYSYTRPPQFNNLWDFYLEDWDESVYSISRYNVISTNLPFFAQLETEAYPTGENFYTGYTMPSTFSITIRENTEFSVYEYFKNWMNKVFDSVNGNFISSSEPKTKQGTIQFYSYKMDLSAYQLFSEKYITEKIKNLQTMMSQTLIQKAKKEASAALPYPLSRLASQGGSILSSKAQSGLNSLMPNFGDMIEEVTTKTFIFENIRILGINETALSYDDGGQMEWTVNFVADRFYDDDLRYSTSRENYRNILRNV